ncbi:MAG: ATP-dependent helicase [Caldilineaceae bacterium SB0670_bin_27]|uniref:ATP-dependent helicase n=1 Tax=Caldilineaceae bacterium SB0664_bin_27 TaxID=2605260 RepID=A0A6B0YRJ7_9CHLR|nr:ATP-dependent helicase [Caldilineaceae bacterium SB0664_bin_27]MYJ77081.1 ATP-dependent helicase [Caldilineaceae bacterium SB0670_bin_27]
MAYQHILDNRTHTVADYLRKNLQSADAFRLVSAYFSIYGYAQLEDALDSVGEVRFLFGDPASVEDVDPGNAEPKSFDVTENGLIPNHALQQKFLAERCAEWVGRDTVSIRSIAQANFLHGKLYLTTPPIRSLVGSSNFTQRGLGASTRANIEINLASDDAEIYAELREWFDLIWSDNKLTTDAKQQVLDALGRIAKEHAPELIYYKTLYELFRADIEARLAQEGRMGDVKLGDTAIWNTLYQFQKDGARSAITSLERHNGCILADSVGLGKTYTALAVIKHYELCNRSVLVLCPRKLRENWSLYQAHTGHIANPFTDDRFAFSLLSHTDLSRDRGDAAGIDLANFSWQNYALIVIDESHNFRNHQGQRYERLLNEVIGKGVKTKVLMLSATPVNTSLIDLRNQIYLMTENRQDSFRESLGVSDIGNLLKRAQTQFRQWESRAPLNGQRNKQELLDNLGSDFYRLLGGVSIARSRRQIEEFYAAEIDRIGRFPDREKPVNVYPATDLEGDLSYKELAERISEFTLSIYRPSDYVVSEKGLQQLEEEKKARNFNQADREQFLIAMIRTNFLKRLESSAHSLTLTLERTIGKIDTLLDKIDRYESRQNPDGSLAEVLPDDDEDDEEFLINRARHPYNLADLDLPAWKKELRQDKETLNSAHGSIAQITPERDGKLARLKQQIRDRDANRTTDRNGLENRKLLVFTTFKDTGEYLYDNLQELAVELNLNIAMVSGDATLTSAVPNNFNSILDNFAPVARGRSDSDSGCDIDLLIATDCISEGQNLQDCDTVLNYDIHWNPIRIIQRFGRIDRIGSQSDSVRMINYWPTEEMEEYLRLQTRVEARMALADAAASGDENPLDNYDGIQGELNFRAQQLKQLLDEDLDLDDLTDDGVTMSDFTLDQFFTQLLHYLERNREELEQTALGAYAVVDSEKDTGVIWVLRQRNASQDKQTQVASPVHPFYIVHVRNDGKIRHGCASVKQTLDLFQQMSLGKTEAIHKLCDEFNRRTENGTDMAAYDSLLNAAVKDISQAHNRTQTTGLGLQGSGDFRLPKSSETPDSTEDFELVTWLVVLPREQD